MRLFSQSRWPGQYALRRWVERHDVLPQRSLHYERHLQLPRKHAPDRQGASFREPSPCQWTLPVEAVHRCDKVQQTKSRGSRRGSLRSDLCWRHVTLLQVLLCFLEGGETGPPVLPPPFSVPAGSSLSRLILVSLTYPLLPFL